MEQDLPEDTLTVRGNLRVLLSGLPIFDGLDDATLDAIASACEWLSLPGGATLFEAGEPSDAMYVLLSGCLGSYAPPQGTDRRRALGRVTAGECVGEMGLVSGRPRMATVVALRDSEILRLSRQAFDQVLRRHPEAMLRIAQLTVTRLETSAHPGPRGRAPGPRSFTLVPQALDVDVASFAMELVEALRPLGSVELVWSVRGADHTSHWFHKLESQNDYVVYVADHAPTSWTRLCMRQADTLLLLARAESPAGPWAALGAARDAQLATQRAELVLLHEGPLLRGAAARWLAVQPGVPHHHVRTSADVPRVARLLTGTAVGLVLSGGGARGFAHLGVIRALREHGIPIDLVGGTSIGAIMGAAAAHGWPDEQMLEVFRRTFVDSNPLGDYTLPLVSLVAGRRVSSRLRREFGDVAIEDLPLPFYCVSANLTSGNAAVHRRGELWRWLRASVAIPGVLPPVMHQGEVFVDGATINNLPVDVMREAGRGVVIGVDVGADRTFTTDIEDTDAPPFWKLISSFRAKDRKRPNIFQVLWRAGMVNSAAATLARRHQTDLLLQPPLEDVDLLNWRAFDRAILSGRRHAQQKLAELPPELRARLGSRPPLGAPAARCVDAAPELSLT
ncbi:MAG: patatin-like phospholipase family protein [Steroidobacteraceae bacterium]|nr:patatin-like phospholipase family protein [Steroidobacteraceae bacterium]